MLATVIRIGVIAVALWVATVLVPGIELGAGSTVSRIGTLLAVALVFGVVNAVIKPIVQVLGCAFYILTLGLIAFVVNALLFLLVGRIAEALGLPFTVDGFWPAFWGAIVVGLVTLLLQWLVPDRPVRG
ncbi:MAG: rane protein [Pseudonocardia sp.]|nr:rane protein [Pseudonocardia sp.]